MNDHRGIARGGGGGGGGTWAGQAHRPQSKGGVGGVAYNNAIAQRPGPDPRRRRGGGLRSAGGAGALRTADSARRCRPFPLWGMEGGPATRARARARYGPTAKATNSPPGTPTSERNRKTATPADTHAGTPLPAARFVGRRRVSGRQALSSTQQ